MRRGKFIVVRAEKQSSKSHWRNNPLRINIFVREKITVCPVNISSGQGQISNMKCRRELASRTGLLGRGKDGRLPKGGS